MKVKILSEEFLIAFDGINVKRFVKDDVIEVDAATYEGNLNILLPVEEVLETKIAEPLETKPAKKKAKK